MHCVNNCGESMSVASFSVTRCLLPLLQCAMIGYDYEPLRNAGTSFAGIVTLSGIAVPIATTTVTCATASRAARCACPTPQTTSPRYAPATRDVCHTSYLVSCLQHERVHFARGIHCWDIINDCALHDRGCLVCPLPM